MQGHQAATSDTLISVELETVKSAKEGPLCNRSITHLGHPDHYIHGSILPDKP